MLVLMRAYQIVYKYFDGINTKEKSEIRIKKSKILSINQRGKNVMTDANLSWKKKKIPSLERVEFVS